MLYRSWSRALIWAAVELFQVESQPEAPPWLAEVLMETLTVFMCSGSVLNFLNLSYRWQVFTFMLKVSFSIFTFLEFARRH